MDVETKNSLSVAVIGGGAAGLVTARQLLREGHTVTIFEQAPQIGGTWLYSDLTDTDNSSDQNHNSGSYYHGTSMYKSLRTNLPRETMAYSDYPFDDKFPGSKDGRQFPGHEEVLRYMEAFTAHFELAQYIRFNTCVSRVEPLEENAITINGSDGDIYNDNKGWRRWNVSYKPAVVTSPSTNSNSTTEEKEQFDAVVVCNGHFTEAAYPNFPGQDTFTGQQLHSHNYRTSESFKDQVVVIIGAGASGVDIAEELVVAGVKRVYLSSRSWQNALTGEALIEEAKNKEKTASQSSLIIQKIGNVVSLGPGNKVTFQDDVVVDHVDTVMYCTGYKYKFPFLELSPASPHVDDNRVENLYQHVFLPEYAPTLSFIGLCWKVLPFFQFELQATWVAKILAGKVGLPCVVEMKQAVEEFYDALDKEGVPKRYTHRLAGSAQWEYDQWLIQAAGSSVEIPEWRIQLYNATGRARTVVGTDKYRDVPLEGGEGPSAEARKEFDGIWARISSSRDSISSKADAVEA